MATLRTIARKIPRHIPVAAALFAFVRLAAGGFRGLAGLGWTDAAVVLSLLVGIGMSTIRRLKKNSVGASFTLYEDLEFGGGLVAAAFIVVAIGGSPLYPIVYLLMAFLVSFLQRNAGMTLLG